MESDEQSDSQESAVESKGSKLWKDMCAHDSSSWCLFVSCSRVDGFNIFFIVLDEWLSPFCESDDRRALIFVGVDVDDWPWFIGRRSGVECLDGLIGVLQSLHFVISLSGEQGEHVVFTSLSQYLVHSSCLQIGSEVVEVVPSWLKEVQPFTCPFSSVIGSGSM